MYALLAITNIFPTLVHIYLFWIMRTPHVYILLTPASAWFTFMFYFEYWTMNSLLLCVCPVTNLNENTNISEHLPSVYPLSLSTFAQCFFLFQTAIRPDQTRFSRRIILPRVSFEFSETVFLYFALCTVSTGTGIIETANFIWKHSLDVSVLS